MKNRCFAAIILLAVFAPLTANSVPIGHCPGLKKLIDSADAIVVLRIDSHLSDFGGPTFYSTHECYIYQTIKGDIPKNARINLQLMNTEGSFATPYAQGSTHLMFLMKKATENEPTEYRTLTFKGAQILLSPLGQEKPPQGTTIEERVENVIKDAIAYQAEEHHKKERFLKGMLGRQEAAEASASAPAPSQPVPQSLVKDIAKCAAIRNDVERLAAYDKLAQDLADSGAKRHTVSGTAKREPKQEWKKIGSFGAIVTVYMSPDGLSDKHYIAQVLHTLRSEKSVQEIWFFDDKSRTPTGVPMTDQQMLYWRAKYSINRNTGHEKFVFIRITDPKASPPGIREEKADIRPGYTE